MSRRLTIALALALLAPSGALAQGPTEGDVVAGDEAFPVKTTVSSQYRMLAVVDEDPENDRMMLYGLKASGEVFPGGSVFLGTGVRHRFVAEPGESGVDMQDTQIGMSWATPVALAEDSEIKLTSTLAVALPTSRVSRTQDLYLAPLGKLGFSLQPIKALTIGFGGSVSYRFHEFAERAGIDGAMNTQLTTGVNGGLDYQVAEFTLGGRDSSVNVGASVGTTYLRRYDARDDHESEFADSGVWLQGYDWEAHLGYSWWLFSAGVSVEHGGRVLRNGIVNPFLGHRDETELAFSLSASL